MVLQEAVKVREALDLAKEESEDMPKGGDLGDKDVAMSEVSGDTEEEKEELRLKLAAVDATIAALSGVTDEDVLTIVKQKRAERDRLKEALINLKPLKVQLRIATEARDKAMRRQSDLNQEERNLTILLDAKRKELREADADVTKLQVNVEHLSRRQAEESMAQLRLDADAHGLSPASNKAQAGTASPCPSQQSSAPSRSSLHWAAGLAASLPPQMAASFQQWMSAVQAQELAAQSASAAALPAFHLPPTAGHGTGAAAAPAAQAQPATENAETAAAPTTPTDYGPSTLGPFRAARRAAADPYSTPSEGSGPASGNGSSPGGMAPRGP